MKRAALKPSKAKRLALDLSSTATGWAFGADKITELGTIAPDSRFNYAERLIIIGDAFQRLLLKYNPDEVVVEELRSMRGAPVVRALCGVRGVIIYLAARAGYPVRFTTQGSNYKNIGLKGNAKKPQVIARVEQLGYKVSNDNEADAVTVFLNSQSEA